MLVPPVYNQSRALFTRPKKIFHRLLNDSGWILCVYFVRAEPADPQPLDVFRTLSQYLYPYISTIQSKERLYSKINLVFCGYIQITRSSSMCNICQLSPLDAMWLLYNRPTSVFTRPTYPPPTSKTQSPDH